MADLGTSENDSYTEDQASSDFADGFTTLPPAKPAAAPGPKTETPAPAAAATEPPATTPAAAPEPAAPKYIQITQELHDRWEAAANTAATFEKRVKDIVNGTRGELEQRIIQKLQAATPVGEAVELPDEVFADLVAEYPELATTLRKTLNKAMKGLRGTGQAATPAAAATEPNDWNARLKELSRQYQIEALEEDHPDWRDVVGAVSDGKHDPENPFRKWLATQPIPYQERINNTDSSAVISRAIDKFKAAAATPAPKPAPPRNTAQADRIRGAVQPKGDGGQPGPSKTPDDDFNEGFRSG